ncbi:hypothetical protein B0H11DRAFT_1932735 [Mycena galericulata]|nr:hypothetical protein B0H11DRAFT_1932735 [Mycena galericulata]
MASNCGGNPLGSFFWMVDAPERQTRNGRVYAAFMENDAVVIPGLRIRDVLIARAEAPQPQDSDCDSDTDSSFSDDDHSDNNGDNGDDQAAPAASPPPTSKRARPHGHGDDDHGGDNDGDNDDGPPAPPALPPPLAKRARPHDSVPLDRTARKKLKKKLAHRERRCEHQETDRGFTPSRPKAVSVMRVRQSDPLSIPIQYAQHTRPVASTSWMGLRDSAIKNAAAREAPDETPAFVLPEARPYTLAAAFLSSCFFCLSRDSAKRARSSASGSRARPILFLYRANAFDGGRPCVAVVGMVGTPERPGTKLKAGGWGWKSMLSSRGFRAALDLAEARARFSWKSFHQLPEWRTSYAAGISSWMVEENLD